MIRENSDQYAAIVLGLLLFQLPVARAVEKYLPQFPLLLVMAVIVLAAGLSYNLLFRRGGGQLLCRLLDSPIPLILFVIAGLAVAFVVYPMADGLKAAGRGSDQDDCVILIARNLLDGAAPYVRSTSYIPNQCSTGPGLALLYAPLVAVGAYALGAVLILAACAAMLRRVEGDWYGAGVFLALCGTAEVTWELLAVGSDFFMIGAGLLLAVLLLERIKDRLPWLALMAIALLVGVLSSGRMLFLYAPLIFVLMLWRHSVIKAVAFGAVALGAASLLVFISYSLTPATFSPLHIFLKGGATAAVAGGPMGALIWCLPAGLLALWLSWRGRAADWRGILALCVGAPMAYIAFANVLDVGVARAEGPNYLILVYPALAAWMVQVARRAREKDEIAVREWQAQTGAR